MFVRLTKAMRLRAGLLALTYLLCVLAPSLAFAATNGSRAAPCLTDEEHNLGIIHVHQPGDGVSRHVHKDGQVHEHREAGHSHVSASDDSDAAKSVADRAAPPAEEPHKAAGTLCCGMVCISALPATVVDMVEPAAPASVCDAENYRNLADNAPPRHYRPPIS
ncbi:hypothetical protein [Bradyrhizobium prioriisuperbiae]|uniref:hypothetical protein n=1 Tax=Bradyrhizobium prioriisuperbiae TaxID=2854389 RepID=UPI0028F0F072|nr:hypothetical protein [Bradyrhizobium prioritasuperba]